MTKAKAKAESKGRDGVYYREDRKSWWGSYEDPDGKRHRQRLKGASTVTQARDALKLLEAKAEKDHALGVKAESGISTKDMLERFRRYQKSQLRPSTYQRLLCIIATLVANLPAQAKAITKSDVAAYMEARRNGDAIAPETDKKKRRAKTEQPAEHATEAATVKKLRPASPATVRKEVQTLRYCLKLAVEDWEYLRENKAQKVRLPKVTDEKPRFLTLGEFRAVLESAPEWMRGPIALAVTTGMRRGELLALRWMDVDFTHGLIHLRSATTKSAEPRVLPLTEAAAQIIEAQPRGKASDLVFGGVNAQKLSVYTPRLFTKLGIHNASFHTLRHTAASWLVQQGESLYATGQVLGHKTPRMTQRYAHLAPEHLAVSAGKLSNAVMLAMPGTLNGEVDSAKIVIAADSNAGE